MDVRRKLVLIVTASILLTAIPGAGLIYGYTQRNILAHEGEGLQKFTSAFTQNASQRFVQGEPKLKALAQILERELARPVQPGEIAEFHRLFELNPDGVWRNRRSGFDGTQESGLFLPRNPQESDKQKIRHLRIKQVMDNFGAAASKPLENVWYLSPHRSEIIFDRALPEFAFDQKADNDYTQTPWVTYTSPGVNPQRKFRFTPPLFDPVPRVWMVSALYPLYVKGEWIGSLGEDMQLTAVLESLFSTGQIYAGTQHFLLDEAGNFILAGPWQRQLESSTEKFHPDLSKEKSLAALLKSQQGKSPSVISTDVEIRGRRYLAIGARLEPVGWQYFRLTPVDEIMVYTHQLFVALMGMILVVTVLSGTLIGTAAGASITRRILALRDAMRGYVVDHQRRAGDQIRGDDEIADAAHVFDDMADSIDRNISEREAAEERLHTLFVAIEQSPTSIVITDLKANLVYVNPQFTRVTGYQPEEVLGANPRMLQSGLTPKATYQDMWDTVTGGKVWHGELVNRRKNGELYWEEAHIAPVMDEAGVITQYVGIKFDISSRKNADEAVLQLNRRLQDLLDAASDVAIIATNEIGVITTFNRGAERMLGYRADEMENIQTPMRLHLPEEVEEAGEALSRQLASQVRGFDVFAMLARLQDQQREWTYVRKNGTRLTVSMALSPVYSHNGVVTGYLGIAKDISQQKKFEKELISAKEAAEAGTRMKSTFLANMSHEIRTPMNGIIGVVQLALEKATEPDLRRYLEQIRTSAKSLLGLINDILDFSKMDAGHMALERNPFAIDTLVHHLSGLFPSRAGDKPIEFRIEIARDVPQALVGDALRLQQVLTNLIDNAIKFTEQGTVEMRISLLKSRQDFTRLHFSVTDTGIGISEQDREKLFKPFSQVDGSSTRRYGGTGLGLSISQYLLRLMDSELRVESTPGKGSTFSFELTLGIARSMPEFPAENSDASAGESASSITDTDEASVMAIALELDRHLQEHEFIPEMFLCTFEEKLPFAMGPQFVMLRKQIQDIDYKAARQTLRGIVPLP